MNKYFDQFDDREDVARAFEASGHILHTLPYPAPDDFPTDEEMVFAAYGGRSYEGSALVVFSRDGKLYEVNGSHCSCYGLEDQWSPEETSIGALCMRVLDPEEYSKEAVERFRELFPPIL